MNARQAGYLALLAAMSGCMTGPRPVGTSPRLYLQANQPSRIWMTLKDGSQMIVEGPRIIDDTVFGWSEGGTEDIMIAVKDIRQVRARKMAVVRTAIIPATLLAGVIVMYSMVEADPGAVAPPDQAQCLEQEIDDCPSP
jgi:hypothetical protein